MQLIKHHANPKGYPKCYALDKTWHPKPSMLDLDFSYKGEWARMPKDRLDKTGPLYKNFYIVRIECYIDVDGEIKKAIYVTRKMLAYYKSGLTLMTLCKPSPTG